VDELVGAEKVQNRVEETTEGWMQPLLQATLTQAVQRGVTQRLAVH